MSPYGGSVLPTAARPLARTLPLVALLCGHESLSASAKAVNKLSVDQQLSPLMRREAEVAADRRALDETASLVAEVRADGSEQATEDKGDLHERQVAIDSEKANEDSDDPVKRSLPSDGTDKDLSFAFLDADFWATHPTLEGFMDIVNELKTHKSKVDSPDKARFVITAYKDCYNKVFKSLPLRSPERPYLLWGFDRCDQPFKEAEVAGTRNDILFVGFDLRPFFNDTAPIMPGVTFASPRGMQGQRFEPTKPTSYFLTFRGDKKVGLNGVSHVRQHLKDGFAALAPKKNDVLVQIHEVDTGGLQNYKVEYGDLFNSSYSLVPRGHGRWTYRLSEAIHACSIPVILADGLTLPYEELIDWSKATIRLPEKLAEDKDASKILAALPKDENKIHEMRSEVCRISDKYFRSMAKRADSLLLDAAVRSDKLVQEAKAGASKH